MKISLRFAVCLFTLVLLAAPLVVVTAQTSNTPPLLMITSKDAAHPVQFQILAPGDVPSGGSLSSKVTIQDEADVTVYVSLENAGGWSSSVIGLLSGSLVRENQYVALEVDQDGAPVADGQAFQLGYRAGYFLFPALVNRPRTFAIFQIVTEGGVEFTGQTPALEGKNDATLSPVTFQIDPESPFGQIVFECHVAAAAQ